MDNQRQTNSTLQQKRSMSIMMPESQDLESLFSNSADLSEIKKRISMNDMDGVLKTIKRMVKKDEQFEGFDAINYKDQTEGQDTATDVKQSKWQLFSKMLFTNKIRFTDETIRQAESALLDRDRELKRQKMLDDIQKKQNPKLALEQMLSGKTQGSYKISDRVLNVLLSKPNNQQTMMLTKIASIGETKWQKNESRLRSNHIDTSPAYKRENRTLRMLKSQVSKELNTKPTHSRGPSGYFQDEGTGTHQSAIDLLLEDQFSQDKNGKRKKHDDKKKITMDDIQILPFKFTFLNAKLPKTNEEGSDEESDILANQYLEFSRNVFRTNMQKAFSNQENMNRQTDWFRSQSLNEKVIEPKNNNKSRGSFSPALFEQRSLGSEFRNQFSRRKSAARKEQPKEDPKSKILEFVRRRSCICTHCVGVVKKQRKGDLIVLDHEKEMIIKFQTQIKNLSRHARFDSKNEEQMLRLTQGQYLQLGKSYSIFGPNTGSSNLKSRRASMRHNNTVEFGMSSPLGLKQTNVIHQMNLPFAYPQTLISEVASSKVSSHLSIVESSFVPQHTLGSMKQDVGRRTIDEFSQKSIFSPKMNSQISEPKILERLPYQSKHSQQHLLAGSSLEKKNKKRKMFAIKSALDWKLGNDIPKKMASHKVYMTSTKEYMQAQQDQIKQIGDEIFKSIVAPPVIRANKLPRNSDESKTSTLHTENNFATLQTKIVSDDELAELKMKTLQSTSSSLVRSGPQITKMAMKYQDEVREYNQFKQKLMTQQHSAFVDMVIQEGTSRKKKKAITQKNTEREILRLLKNSGDNKYLKVLQSRKQIKISIPPSTIFGFRSTGGSPDERKKSENRSNLQMYLRRTNEAYGGSIVSSQSQEPKKPRMLNTIKTEKNLSNLNRDLTGFASPYLNRQQAQSSLIKSVTGPGLTLSQLKLPTIQNRIQDLKVKHE